MDIELIVKEARWIGKIAQSSIQKKVIDACEPLLVFIVKQAHEYYEKKIKEFEQEKKKEENRVVRRTSDYIRNFARNDDEIFSLLVYVFRSNETSIGTLKYLKDFELDQDSKDRYFKRTEESIRESNLYKLTEVVQKYVTKDFVEISNINVKRGSKGFEITANLTDNQNRSWTFQTNAIPAGGYNIQQFHYRYLVNLSSPEVPMEIVRKKITDEIKFEKERKKQEKLDERQKKENEAIIRRKISQIREIGSDYKHTQDLIKYCEKFLIMNDDEIRNWIRTGEWGSSHFVIGDDKELLTKSIVAVKNFFNEKLKQAQKRLDESKQGYSVFYNENGKAKYSKEQLYKMIENKEI